METYNITTRFGRRIQQIKEDSEATAVEELNRLAKKYDETLYLFRVEKEEKKQFFVAMSNND
jgi:hypothetical protein